VLHELEGGSIYSAKHLISSCIPELQTNGCTLFLAAHNVSDLRVNQRKHFLDDGHSVPETCGMTTGIKTDFVWRYTVTICKITKAGL
jgi:hypothetical protein